MPKRQQNKKTRLDRLNALKAARGSLTQTAASRLTGVSRSLWSFWECKKRPMSLAQLNRVAVALDLDDREAEAIREWWGFLDGEAEVLPPHLEHKMIKYVKARKQLAKKKKQAKKLARVKKLAKAEAAKAEAA